MYAPMAMQMPPAQPATGMFTRNLIGSLTVNAFKLTDTEGKMGFWFVLQDLSVRTEGQFRYVFVRAFFFFFGFVISIVRLLIAYAASK